MIKYKTEQEIKLLKEAGKIHAQILKELSKKVKPGAKPSDFNSYAEKLIDEAGCTASFLGYTPDGVKDPYPASLCVSVNEEIVHGIPSENKKVFKNGDIVTLDLGVTKEGMIVDGAVTLAVEDVDEAGLKLIRATGEALNAGIKAVKLGGHIGDIGAVIMKVAQKYGFSIAQGLSGHGVGFNVHEEPYVPNEAIAGDGPEIKLGLVIAIEPMLCEGAGSIKRLPDHYTYVTKDGKRSAHFEHTIAVTKNGVEVLTKL